MPIDPTLITIGLNAGALIWGASKINTSVATLTKAVDKMEKTMEAVGEEVGDHETRITVLEDRDGRPPRPSHPARAA